MFYYQKEPKGIFVLFYTSVYLYFSYSIYHHTCSTYYVNIGTILSQQIKSPKNKSFKSYLTKKYNNTFTFQSTSKETIGQIIDKLAPKTSFGFDGISTKLINITMYADI